MTRIANDNAHEAKTPDDDIIQPFQLELSGLRGRVVRLGSTLNDILSTHNYPLPVAHLLAETVATSLLLSSMLKYEGIFTLQTASDGPVRAIVADVTSAGAVRSYAGYAQDLVKAMEAADERPEGGLYQGFDLRQLAGKGYLAFTVDQGDHTERYQGIVSLSGDTLAESVSHYFDQSEQIGTTLKVHASYDPNSGWRAGAIMLQRTPDASIGNDEAAKDAIPFRPELAAEKDEDWNRSTVLLQSARPEELVSGDLHSHELLMRLFHEEGVRIFSPQPVIKKCRCSEERVRDILGTLSMDDREHAAANGIIEMTCEFCSKTYRFNADTLQCVAVDEQAKTH